MKTEETIKFEVIEDNGGGLYLFWWEDPTAEAPSHVYGGWEHQDSGYLLTNLEAIIAREVNPAGDGWESGGMDEGISAATHYADFDQESARNGGHSVVADQSMIDPRNMGIAAKNAFGWDSDEAWEVIEDRCELGTIHPTYMYWDETHEIRNVINAPTAGEAPLGD